jgi:long-chain fatty acid transport protein
LALAVTLSVSASTNGDNLLGIGASSRALGGSDIAQPQDALGAISGNPSGISFLTQDALSEADVAVTFFDPDVSTSIGSISASSASKTYIIPSLAVAGPIGDKTSPWQYAFGLYGVSGLGVDYRNTAVDTTFGATPYPLAAGVHTQLQILEVAPSVAYRISSQWSVGAAFDVDYGRLNLGEATKGALGVGFEPGVTYQASTDLSLGASYTSSKPITYKGVVDLSGNGTLDNLKLESPQQLAAGAAYQLVPGSLLLLTDIKWVNWSGAAGYKDFDWKNSWIYGVGLQYQALPKKLVLRAGYTYGNNPVNAHNNFNGAGSPTNVTEVQGNYVNNYYYETFRIVGFPAVVENHVSFGFSYHFNGSSSVDIGYTHAFKSTISEQGTNVLGLPTTLSSSLSENSIDVGFRFLF